MTIVLPTSVPPGAVASRLPRVLIVEDDVNSLDVTSAFVAESGADVVGATSVEEALAALARHGDGISLVITDIKLRGRSGFDVFRQVRQDLPGVPVILVTAFGNTDEAVAAMRDGALYYFTKPVNFPLLLRIVRGTLEKQALQAQVADLHARLAGSVDRHILGSSRALQAALEQATAVAGLDTTVLLTGETGTGKELFAQLIHERSLRRKQPIVAINCAALPEPLLESELFGHERGAFTGAVARKPGKFEMATGGTLFLDEVADMSLALQAKLLRALELKRIEPLGATRTIQIDVRIVAATNRDLAAAVRSGTFREDLFYRLHVFPILLPPLRERDEDIPILAVHFLNEYNRALGKPVEGFDADALDALQAYAWPGNVRELRHAIERAVILAKSRLIGIADLPRPLQAAPATPGPTGAAPKPLAELERNAILAALDAAGGNRSKAARLLGITRNQIQYWLRTHQPPR